MSTKILLLALESHDLSQAEKKTSLLQGEQFTNANEPIFTQNANFFSTMTILSENSEFAKRSTCDISTVQPTVACSRPLCNYIEI